MDLTTAASTRLDRLRLVLEQRVRRSIDTAPPLVRAGVLIPLITRDSGIELLFTRRTDTVLTHKGQISFPGGSIDADEVPLQVGHVARRFRVQAVARVARHINMVAEDDRA